MGKYSNSGPEWTDVEMLMRAIGTMHGGQVGLTLLPRGTGATGGLTAGAGISFAVASSSDQEDVIAVLGDWPCDGHKTFAGHCFSLLHQLDFTIGQAYRAKDLWE